MKTLINKVRAANRVFVVGNGGSAANAMHLCNDLLLCGKPAFTLDPSTLTAFANDFGYAWIFSKWLLIVGSRGDLLIALSGSGKSPNILNAVEAAHLIGMDVWEEYGARQGFDMQSSEERQVWLGHEVMRALKADAKEAERMLLGET